MKIIAHGKVSIGSAVSTAELALAAGVSSVTIECAPSPLVPVLTAITLAYCPVAECCECDANPCPFERKADGEVLKAQATYDQAVRNLKTAEDNLRKAAAHA
jgi:hypothetical protein